MTFSPFPVPRHSRVKEIYRTVGAARGWDVTFAKQLSQVEALPSSDLLQAVTKILQLYPKCYEFVINIGL